MTKTILAFFASSFLTVAMNIPARAEEVAGRIEEIDEERELLTLDDGSTYKLPGNFDYAAVARGMPVVLIYDEAATRAVGEPVLHVVTA